MPRLRGHKADLVLANLLERALYDLAPAFAQSVAAGGRAILSGLTQTQARGIAARYSSLGFAMEKRIHSRWMDDLGHSPSQRARCPRLIAGKL